MKKISFLLAVLIILPILNTPATSAQELVISNLRVETAPSPLGLKILISCAVKHSIGPLAIFKVAASITTEKINSSYPILYDDGTHGDKVSGDGIYSLEITAPDVTGQAQIVFIAVDTEMNEIESEPISFMIQ